MNWQDKHYKDVVREFKSDSENGLCEQVAKEMLQVYGPNCLEEKKGPPFFIRFIKQFNDLMIMILLAAAFMSFFVSFMTGEHDYADPIIILLIVSLNAILGLMQENKAEKALEALKKMSSPMAKVKRDGHLFHIETERIVPGDLVFLEAGDLVPADGRLVWSVNLRAEESALTGESLAVEKDAELIVTGNTALGDYKNMVFASSSISYGRGAFVVTSTGMNTQMGQIAKMILADDTPETPLQKKLDGTGKILGIGALAICGVIFGMGVLREIPALAMFMTSISLAVAAIPEGLPAIVTIMLAVGVSRMAKRNAVIRKLPAVETLGSANVICSDKTGTLTQNKMRVTEVSNGQNRLSHTDAQRKYILELSMLCNDCVVEYEKENIKIIGDATEAAFIYAGEAIGLKKEQLDRKFQRVSEVPFDSKRKLMSTIHKQEKEGYFGVTKGAPDVLLKICNFYWENGKSLPLTEAMRKNILANNERMANQALRVLGIATSLIQAIPQKATPENTEMNLCFVGLVGMIDPPRKEAAQAVAICKKAGIRAVMVTGDHSLTATAIAKSIGIMSQHDLCLTGQEIATLSQTELENRIEDYTVFARVSPEHKVRIVKAFQAKGNVVAMTGDGVNDAPALKAADIGCAMGLSGTDTAKAAADMVLTDDNFATIVAAVKEGRGIYANIRKAVHFLLSSNIGEIITIFVAILLGWDTPLLAIHLLWVNLVTDSLPAIALGVDPPEEGIMNKPPYKNQSSLFNGGLWQQIIIEGCMIGMLSLLAFGIGTIYFDTAGSHIIGRTMAFATLSLSQLVHAFNMRSEKSIFSIHLFENRQLVWAFVVGVLLQVSVIMVSPLSKIFKVTQLSPVCWLLVTVLCIMPILLVETEKWMRKTIQQNPSDRKTTKSFIKKNA